MTHALSLHVDHHLPRPLRPGSRITGSVRLTVAPSSPPLSVAGITVVLRGESRTRFVVPQSYHTGSGRGATAFASAVPVLDVRSAVALSPTPFPVHGPGTREWPFAIAISPSTTTPADCGTVFATAGRSGAGPRISFAPSTPQPLPPSFAASSCAGSSASGTCSVRYALSVVLASTHPTVLTTPPTAIDVRPLRRDPHPAWNVSTQTCTFDPRSPAPSSLRHRLHTAIRPAGASTNDEDAATTAPPAAPFSLTARIPQTAVPDRALPLFLGVTSPPRPPPATVTLASVSIHLRAATGIRGISAAPAPETGETNWTDGDGGSGSAQGLLASWSAPPSSPAGIPLPELLDLRPLCAAVLPAAAFAPTLKTPNVVRQYALRVLVSVRCAGELFTAAFRVRELVLLGGDDGDGGGDKVPPLSSSSSSLPPSFEETMLPHGAGGELRHGAGADDCPPPGYAEVERY